MNYESYPHHYLSQAAEKEMLGQMRGIRVTLVVGMIGLLITLAPWWLLGMGLLMDQVGGGGGD